MKDIILIILALFSTTIYAQVILEKSDHDVIDRDDDYWYVKVSQKVNRPAFTSYIRFYNKHTAKCEHEIDVSRSSNILYYNTPPQIIFRTTGHYWSEGDSYYVTLDEGALYSSQLENSTAYKSSKFWRFRVIRPLTITDSDSLMGDISDEDENRLYIDETAVDSVDQSNKSINTGNPFELDLILLENINRYQTRSSQTILTLNVNLLLKRNRSTICQAEYFDTMTQESNTNQDFNEQEERIGVVKKQRTENLDLLSS